METATLIVHIGAGAIAMFTGFTAMFVRKGSALHRLAGNVFFVSMLTMGAGASILGQLHSNSEDLISGLLVMYLVSTAWMAIKRKPNTIGLFEYCSFILVITAMAISAYMTYLASINDSSVSQQAIGTAVIGLMAVGDFNVILKGGLSGKQRLIRHLWRMCFAVFVAAGPIFIARVHLFPEIISATGAKFALFALPFVPILLIFYWLVRIRFSQWFKNAMAAPVSR